MLSGYRICNGKEVQINSFHGQVCLEEKKKKKVEHRKLSFALKSQEKHQTSFMSLNQVCVHMFWVRFIVLYFLVFFQMLRLSMTLL